MDIDRIARKRFARRLGRGLGFAGLCVVPFFARSPEQNPLPQKPERALELARAARPWEFLSATGQRAALFGNEAGQMEAWVYPLKLLRDFHLVFHVDGKQILADALVRSISVRPESSTILYAGDDYTVRETFFVPVKESGAVVLLDVDTEEPLEIEVAFRADFQLEWPGAIGGTYVDTLPAEHAFEFGEESHRLAGVIGSPSASVLQPEYQTNYSESQECSFRLGSTGKGKETKLIVLSGSTQGPETAIATYRRLTASYPQLLQESAEYYQGYLKNTVNLELPDKQLQEAYDWARVSVIQGLAANPDLGTGLIAGYRTSGESQRPGFAWFFGRDALWTSLALDASGDFETTRTDLTFLSKFQREDGKIPHEISQSAGRVAWFKDFPYAYASADATPLYIITMDDYLRQSGDTAFVKTSWSSIRKAYEFLQSTRNGQGFPLNRGIGHGWVEGGPLLPVNTELYQSALGAEATRAFAALARAAGQKDVSSEELDKSFGQQRAKLNDAFWLPEQNRFAYALDLNDHAVDELSVLATVPMWFGVLDENKANKTITQLAGFEHQTDWGMRIISSSSPKFSGQGYHFGSVWPLFTGWASVGEYRYHRAQPAFSNLRANALLAFDGSLGHVTEVLSGSEYQPLSTSSPQQIWSAAMVVSPILRGLFGIERDAQNHTLVFAPHPPADWSTFAIRNVSLGDAQVDLRYQKMESEIIVDVDQKEATNFILDFQPALSLRAKVLGVELNGKAAEFHVAANETDQHVLLHLPLSAKSNTIRIRVKNDFGVAYRSALPMLGETSQGLRILSESWSPARDSLTLEVAGVAGASYDLALWNPKQFASVDGAKLMDDGKLGSIARVEFPAATPGSFAHASVVFHFEKTENRKEK